MNDDTEHDPLTRTYVLVVVAAVLLMLVLYWFTSGWNIPMEAR